MAPPSAPIGTYFDFDWLARAQTGKLSLLEVGRYPDIVERHNVDQILPDADALPDFEPPPANGSGNRRTERRVTEVELSLFQLGLALQHLRIRRLGRHLRKRRLRRSGLRCSQIGDCFRKLVLRLQQDLLISRGNSHRDRAIHLGLL